MQESRCEPNGIHNLKHIFYVGVQFLSYIWMCVGGREIYCAAFFDGMSEGIDEKEAHL